MTGGTSERRRTVRKKIKKQIILVYWNRWRHNCKRSATVRELPYLPLFPHPWRKPCRPSLRIFFILSNRWQSIFQLSQLFPECTASEDRYISTSVFLCGDWIVILNVNLLWVTCLGHLLSTLMEFVKVINFKLPENRKNIVLFLFFPPLGVDF